MKVFSVAERGGTEIATAAYASVLVKGDPVKRTIPPATYRTIVRDTL